MRSEGDCSVFKSGGSYKDPEFVEKVQAWLSEDGQLMAELYGHAVSTVGWRWIRSVDELEAWLSGVARGEFPPLARGHSFTITLCRFKPWFAGKVTPELFPEAEKWLEEAHRQPLIVETSTGRDYSDSYCMDASDFIPALEEFLDREVVIGEEPDTHCRNPNLGFYAALIPWEGDPK
ncbi:MAG: hypothetical protein AMXMBFR33_48680 [Candidatus Xenobia bacterium]